MDGSAVLLTTTALILISMSSASTVDPFEQRMQIFIPKRSRQYEINPITNIALYFSKLHEKSQSSAVTGDDVPDVYRQLSDGGTPLGDGDITVQFPPGRPSSNNIQAICLNGAHRPHYAQASTHHQEKAKAVNQAESWFSTCCDRNETWAQEWTLCCATQAWELVLNSFCEFDISIKHRVHDCCKIFGKGSLDCFQKEAPNPNYEPTENEPVPPPPFQEFFNFDNRTCDR
ncbi:uncharacterized protein ecm1a isoform X2 [Genypterus blacodes]|uniref:uncharacterized protein ecm1a isoform X2 n=1 Tax=Genypterus blacodes TaxID=154954 RepID=UPI003F77054B